MKKVTRTRLFKQEVNEIIAHFNDNSGFIASHWSVDDIWEKYPLIPLETIEELLVKALAKRGIGYFTDQSNKGYFFKKAFTYLINTKDIFITTRKYEELDEFIGSL